MNATDGHFQGGGVEKVGATLGHNTPRVDTPAADSVAAEVVL
jgi:hypothetical protein